MQTIDIGESAGIDTDWHDGGGGASEPSAITLTIHPPSGADVVKMKADMTGSESGALAGTDDRWSFDQVVTLEGLWRYDVEGVVAGVNVSLPSGMFLVGPSSRAGGPCEPWCTWDDVTRCGPVSIQALNSAQREETIDHASEMLWNLSGRVHSGICQTTRSLCRSCVVCYPSICDCRPINGFDLGIRRPVLAVWDVFVDGVQLDPTEYTVIDKRWLARTDRRAWPTSWNLLDETKFRASWAFGRPIPTGGRRSAALLSVVIAKSCPTEACTLPDGTSQIASEGVTYVIDPATAADGFTGIHLVDEWLAADRIGRRPRSSFFAPGAQTNRTIR